MHGLVDEEAFLLAEHHSLHVVALVG